jgi:tetratricopeptide (TPR) repeat protein
MSLFSFRAKILLLSVLAFAASTLSTVLASEIELQTMKTHCRWVIQIDENVQAQFKQNPQGFEVRLKGVSFSDLGAPLGSEKAWQAQTLSELASIKDSKVTALELVEDSEGVRLSGKWKYPEGPNAPAAKVMEAFDYRDKNPARFVVDFWLKGGPSVAEARVKQHLAEQNALKKKEEEEAKLRQSRRLASDQQRSEIDDVARFCKQPLSKENDIFLQFLPYHEKVDFTRWFSLTTPDNQFPYFEPQAKSKLAEGEKTAEKDEAAPAADKIQDAEYVRLALDLYRKTKFGLVIKTLDFFDKEHPKSPFQVEMKFLRANTLLKLGIQDDAMKILNQLLQDGRKSPVGLYSGMFLAASKIAKGDHLAALESFLWLIAHFPENRLAWVFHLGAAEAMYSLKQTDRAAKEYQWIVENGPDEKAKAEGALRIGDLYLLRFQYDQALAAYFEGISHFQTQADGFAAVYINRAESLYGLGEYGRAREAFTTFLKNFPGHPAGWRATVRLGEIYGIGNGGAVVNADDTAKSRQWFYDTVNLYPMSAGATLARLWLLPCGDHGGFNAESADRFLTEDANRFDGHGEVSLSNYDAFRGLMRVRGLVSMAKLDDTADAAIAEFSKTHLPLAKRLLSQLIGLVTRKHILELLGAGKRYEALSFYQSKQRLLPRSGTAAELDYLLELSQAASDLGLATAARQINGTYAKQLAAPVTGEGERKIASLGGGAKESAPAPAASPAGSKDEFDRRLKTSDQTFADGKALWIQTGVPHGRVEPVSPAMLEKIRSAMQEVSPESRFAYERELILGLLDEHAGNLPSALVHALQAQLLLGQTPLPVSESKTSKSAATRRVRVDGWVAALQAKLGHAQAALDLYRSMEPLVEVNHHAKTATAADTSQESVLGVPKAPYLDDLFLAEGEICDREQLWGEAAKVYERAMKKGMSGNRVAYGYARALLNLDEGDDREKAIEALTKVAESKTNDFWKDLASQTLADEQSAGK